MNKFNDAILHGLQSAQQADASMMEIYQIISELSESVRYVTEGQISIAKNKIPVGNSIDTALAAALGSKIKYHEGVFLRREVAPHQTYELARIDIPPSGYPCEVFAASRSFTCHDAESLIRVFQQLLAGPEAGRAILRLKAVEPSEN